MISMNNSSSIERRVRHASQSLTEIHLSGPASDRVPQRSTDRSPPRNVIEEVDREPFVSQDVNPEAEDRANEVAAESQTNEVKVQFADEQGHENAAAPLTPLDEAESEDDENRNKRYLNFGFGLGGSGSGGSGNFLFDIIRVSLSQPREVFPCCYNHSLECRVKNGGEIMPFARVGSGRHRLTATRICKRTEVQDSIRSVPRCSR